MFGNPSKFLYKEGMSPLEGKISFRRTQRENLDRDFLIVLALYLAQSSCTNLLYFFKICKFEFSNKIYCFKFQHIIFLLLFQFLLLLFNFTVQKSQFVKPRKIQNSKEG